MFDDFDTLLYRQIHPSFLLDGRATSQAFRPTPKDEKKLSVYNGALISPDAAYLHYTQQLELDTAGVMAVSVTECRDLELQARPDPNTFPEHAFIDFLTHSIKAKGKLLKAKASSRGWIYQDS